jgi:hypothetical protein
MDLLLGWGTSLASRIDYEGGTPLVLINHILQAWCFSSSLCNLVAVALKIINFAYAEEVASSKLTQFLGLLLLYYLKIWDYYSGLLYILSIFSLFMVCLYVYDCCGNISHSFDKRKEQYRDLALIFSYTIMFATTAYIIWQIFKNEERPLEYTYSGIYLVEVVMIAVGNAVRKRSIIYSLLGVLTINYLIAARHFFHDKE